MTKLLILGKRTLVRPKSGAEFVQHPEDQELIPGVAEAIARYAADGWVMAIASNQGGCMIRERKPFQLIQRSRADALWQSKSIFGGGRRSDRPCSPSKN